MGLSAAVSQQVQTGRPRRCRKCGGLIADRDRTTCTCKLFRAEVGKGQQFVFTTRELRQIIATLRRARVGLPKHRMKFGPTPLQMITE